MLRSLLAAAVLASAFGFFAVPASAENRNYFHDQHEQHRHSHHHPHHRQHRW